MMIDVIIRSMECFVLAVTFGLLPLILGFALGWIMRGEKMGFYDYLEKLVLKLDEEGKLLDGEKEKLLESIKEIKESKDGKNGK